MIHQPSSPRRSRGRIGTILAGLALLSLISACEKPNNYAPPPPPEVTVMQPQPGPVTTYLEFTGNIQSIRTVELRARVEGYLEKVLYSEGDVVDQGQLLFLIQQDTYQAQLQKAQAEVLANKARLMHAETEFARFSELQKEDAAAQTDVDRWHYERDAARAAVMAAEAQVELAKLNLSYTRVTAPFRGRVTRRLKDPGNVVGAGEETVLAVINEIDPIYAYFTISEQDLLRVRDARGLTTKGFASVPPIPIDLALANESGYPHQGQLDYRGIFVDAKTGTLQLRAIFRNPDYVLIPGMFARLRAPLGAPETSLLVPQDAVGYDQLGSYVLVVGDKNVVERRSVTPGATTGQMIAIRSGLDGTESVIVNGLLRAIPGRTVTPVKAPAAPADIGKIR